MDSKKKITVLHVEDDDAIRLSVDFALNHEGYEVYSATNGQDALDFLSTRANEIDLIFLDVMMPVMNGFAFCTEQAKDLNIADIPVLIYSADSRHKLTAEAMGHPFLSKPFNLTDLYSGIEKYVRK